jgi:hypothetical protein
MARPRVPFNGEPPMVAKGDAVLCMTADGNWWPMTADGPARYDEANAVGKVFLTVPVVIGPGRIVNWPAEHVRTEEAGR